MRLGVPDGALRSDHVVVPVDLDGDHSPDVAAVVLLPQSRLDSLRTAAQSRIGWGSALLAVLLAVSLVLAHHRQARRDHVARHDHLTGLGNRTLLAEAVQTLGRDPYTLLLLDLDGFKDVNDTLGHAAGDELLVQVAAALRTGVRRDDLVIRLGGDEFAILLARNRATRPCHTRRAGRAGQARRHRVLSPRHRPRGPGPRRRRRQRRRRVRSSDVPTSRLKLEITETAVAQDAAATIGVLRELRAAGIQISLDDFGAGYTSLAYLTAVPLTELKIDRSFVQAVSEHGDTSAVVPAVIELGHRLGLTIVAEGVETEATSQELTALGCGSIQGFLYSHPLPPEQIERWIAARNDLGDGAAVRERTTLARPM